MRGPTPRPVKNNGKHNETIERQQVASGGSKMQVSIAETCRDSYCNHLKSKLHFLHDHFRRHFLGLGAPAENA